VEEVVVVGGGRGEAKGCIDIWLVLDFSQTRSKNKTMYVQEEKPGEWAEARKHGGRMGRSSIESPTSRTVAGNHHEPTKIFLENSRGTELRAGVLTWG
jgi:hypothetical protein